MKPIMVDPKIAKAMEALWAILFCKEVGFFNVIIEDDATHVVNEINSPPHISLILGTSLKVLLRK
jgi:D-alanine-D-alanine ligase-like ATP-grasp enzyme